MSFGSSLGNELLHHSSRSDPSTSSRAHQLLDGTKGFPVHIFEAFAEGLNGLGVGSLLSREPQEGGRGVGGLFGGMVGFEPRFLFGYVWIERRDSRRGCSRGCTEICFVPLSTRHHQHERQQHQQDLCKDGNRDLWCMGVGLSFHATGDDGDGDGWSQMPPADTVACCGMARAAEWLHREVMRPTWDSDVCVWADVGLADPLCLGYSPLASASTGLLELRAVIGLHGGVSRGVRM